MYVLVFMFTYCCMMAVVFIQFVVATEASVIYFSNTYELPGFFSTADPLKDNIMLLRLNV